jgi:glycine/D-amino acid oxidase-like deaminating enzyme
MKSDVLLVGDGLTGSCLAHTLFDNGISFKWLGANKAISASKVAAGLYHPLVFKRPGFSWNADTYVPFSNRTYQKWEMRMRAQFFLNGEMLRIFGSESECQLWEKFSLNHPNSILPVNQDDFKNIKAPFGLGAVQDATRIDVGEFVCQSMAYFKQSNIYKEQAVAFNEFEINDDAVVFEGETYRYVIFAEGWPAIAVDKAEKMMKPVKGEVLTIRIPDFDAVMVHGGVYIVPFDDGTYKVGSNFDWNNLNNVPTPDGLEFLTSKVKAMLKVPFDVVKHEASVRPASIDRRPLLGFLPNNSSVFVCNGMGSKGALLAPNMAQITVETLFENKPLSSEINWIRQWDR